MTPEEIRKVFAENHDDEYRVRQAVYMALDQLEWEKDGAAKAKSPYALTRLTEGLPQADAIIAMAAEMMPAFKTRMRVKNVELAELIGTHMTVHCIMSPPKPSEMKGVERIIHEIGTAPPEARLKTLLARLQTLMSDPDRHLRRKRRRRTSTGQAVP